MLFYSIQHVLNEVPKLALTSNYISMLFYTIQHVLNEVPKLALTTFKIPSTVGTNAGSKLKIISALGCNSE